MLETFTRSVWKGLYEVWRYNLREHSSPLYRIIVRYLSKITAVVGEGEGFSQSMQHTRQIQL